MTLRRGLLLGFGTVASLIAVVLLAAGGVLLWADSKREEDGFFTTSTEQFQTTSYALASEDVDLASDAPGWVFGSGRFGDVRLTGTSNDPAEDIFIGIGGKEEVAAYLEGVEHDVVTDIDYDPFSADFRREPGEAVPAPPASETFWEASTQGSGTQSLEWEVDRGNWQVVVMNGDPSPGVDVEMAFGANIGIMLGLGIGFLAVGVALLIGGVTMIIFGARQRQVDGSREAGGAGLDVSADKDPADAPAGDASSPEGPPNGERRDEGG